MNALQYRANTLFDTSAELPVIGPGEQYAAETIVAFKDEGSRRAAMVAVGAFGQLIALRVAKRKTLEEGQAFATDGSSPFSTLHMKQATQHLIHLVERLNGASESAHIGDATKQDVPLPRGEADMMVDCMEAAAELTPKGQPDKLGYYSAVIPRLLEDAVLSVDQGNFKYEI